MVMLVMMMMILAEPTQSVIPQRRQVWSWQNPGSVGATRTAHISIIDGYEDEADRDDDDDDDDDDLGRTLAVSLRQEVNTHTNYYES